MPYMIHASYNHEQKDPIDAEKHGDIDHMKDQYVFVALPIKVY